jgi:hypothetical protein
VSDADEMEHMLRRAGIEHVWSRDDGQLCLNIGQLGFSFDVAEQLHELLSSADDDEPTSLLAKLVRDLRKLRDVAAVDRWPTYDRALRALESL